MASLLDLLSAHPALLPLVVWPVLTAAANLAQGALRARWPRLAALLSASGLDLGAAVRALSKGHAIGCETCAKPTADKAEAAPEKVAAKPKRKP